jgi:hypothetical protein
MRVLCSGPTRGEAKMSTTKGATFTTADANRVLPLVRSIVADLVSDHARMKDADRERRALDVESAGSAGSAKRVEELKDEAAERRARIEGYLKELHGLGVEVKDYDRGLVDFPAERDGRPVFLCWQMGEESVSHWHALDKGFADRRTVERGDPIA